MTRTYHLPPAEQHIEALHAWIITFADGGEGIISVDVDTPIGPRHVPLLSSKRDVAERMQEVAMGVVAGMDKGDACQVTDVRLMSFQKVGP